MTANKRVSARSLGSDLAKVDSHIIQQHEYEELPELTDDMLTRGIVNKGGRPRSENPRKLISIRLPDYVRIDLCKVRPQGAGRYALVRGHLLSSC